jgi:lycopene beta-cyclase
MRHSSASSVDFAIVGGGLSGGLLALAIRLRHPDATIRLIDPAEKLGGTHIWSFFDSDIAARDRAIVEPLIARSWDSYDVAFPARKRTIDTAYNSITSANFDTVVRELLGNDMVVTGDAVVISANKVTLSDQRTITARAVIDARGPGDLSHFTGGWQKFVGRMLHLQEPHGISRPVIMDATVPQLDGYRFVYLLPFGPTDIFVEDTYYSDGPILDVPGLETRIASYAAERGWDVQSESYAEQGVLPVVSGGDVAAYRASAGDEAGVARIGLRAAMFHAVTSYTLPDAVRTASRIADAWPIDGTQLAAIAAEEADKSWQRGKFYRLLNRMLFKSSDPDQRYRILEHFHRLPQPVIERFYAGQTRFTDVARILSGRPPVAIGRAVKAMLDPT